MNSMDIEKLADAAYMDKDIVQHRLFNKIAKAMLELEDQLHEQEELEKQVSDLEDRVSELEEEKDDLESELYESRKISNALEDELNEVKYELRREANG